MHNVSCPRKAIQFAYVALGQRRIDDSITGLRGLASPISGGLPMRERVATGKFSYTYGTKGKRTKIA